MAHDCHNDLPTCLLKSWTPEQLDYMHDIDWWRAIISQTEGVEIVDMHAMECTAEAWANWLAQKSLRARRSRCYRGWRAGIPQYHCHNATQALVDKAAQLEHFAL